MGLILVLVAWIGSIIPLFIIPAGTGGWLLVAVLAGALSCYLGFGTCVMSMLSDDGGRKAAYYLWWIVGIVLAGGGGILAVYSLAMLVWRGAGISVDVEVSQ